MRRSLKQTVKDAFTLFFEDIKSAKWAIILIVAYFAFLKKMLRSLCPVVLLTGFPCPGCGLTRAGFRLLHLDFAGAWRMHPFIFLILLLVIVFGVERYILLRERMPVFTVCAVFVIAGMVLFYGWRMAHLFPEVPPMTYYRHNLLSRIASLIRAFK